MERRLTYKVVAWQDKCDEAISSEPSRCWRERVATVNRIFPFTMRNSDELFKTLYERRLLNEHSISITPSWYHVRLEFGPANLLQARDAAQFAVASSTLRQ
jgi:hypothetical protein